MTLQLALSFGHIHLENLASGSTVASLAASKAPSSEEIQLTIPRMRRTTFARSARLFISPRHHSCRMRRFCRRRQRLERSSIPAFSVSFLARRNVRHFNRARLRSHDSGSLLV